MLHTLDVKAGGCSAKVRFGLRDFKSEGTRLTLNGRPVFLRGRHDACVWPLTGAVPMEATPWRKYFATLKAYGLNHVRFHSWCPPDAAFEAADEAGFFLQPEFSAFGGDFAGDAAFRRFCLEESKRIVDAYANHPSFVMFTLGNECRKGRRERVEIVRALRAHDPRPLYAQATNGDWNAPRQCEGDDFWVTFRSCPGAEGNARGSYAHCDAPLGAAQLPGGGTMRDFSSAMRHTTIPLIGHETGQFQAYPDYSEIPKYTGVLKPVNLEVFRRRLKTAGLLGYAADFCRASGALMAINYREEIEEALRTPGLSGFQLLDLQDFPGQGTALVGILNAFMESKGFISPEDWRHFCAPTVLLARFPRYTYEGDEKFSAEVQVAHHGAADILTGDLGWRIVATGGETPPLPLSGDILNVSVPVGAVTSVGRIEATLPRLPKAARLELQLTLAGVTNTYPLWVYPRMDDAASAGIELVRDIASADRALAEGRKALCILDLAKAPTNAVPGFFTSDFWNWEMFNGIARKRKVVVPGTLGLLVDDKHPALAGFPTSFHSDYQWRELIFKGVNVVLDGDKEADVIVRGIDNITRNRSLGVIWEKRRGKGRAVYCSLDLEAAKDLPEARALRRSLLSYLAQVPSGAAEPDRKGGGPAADLRIDNGKKATAAIGGFRTREFLPRLGAPAHLLGKVANAGSALGPSTLEAKASAGAAVSPSRIDVPGMAECAEVPFEWRVDAGTNGVVEIDFTLRLGDTVAGKARKRLVFMPETDPDFSAKAWNPPVSPTRTYYVDSADGDDMRDGLSPATAWKTLAKANRVALGPGGRLLLRRGSVFNEELAVSARGSAENWAEIGAYGEGMRPQIRRDRHINDRCGRIADSAYLAVRDIVFCNAGSGMSFVYTKPGPGHLLVERCLAHHIEGIYRFNSHGIPEWRDEPGAAGPGGRSCGLWAGGPHARHVVLRDCETYQCSSGFSVGGTDAFVTRMLCHDNYAHNTSPHPYNLSSRSWMTDCVFDASGWHAAAGTMGIMLAGNSGFVIRGCHFLNQPDSGSPDEGGIDFEWGGENCLVENCTFRNNAGAAIEVLGLRSPQTRNVHIRRCKFDRDNHARRNGPAEIQIWGGPRTPRDIACSNGIIEENGCVLVPGVPFYVNESPSSNDWTLVRNREFDFSEDLDRAFPYVDPPKVEICGEVWTDCPEAALSATVAGRSSLAWEQTEGPARVTFARPSAACTRASFPAEGDYRVQIKAENGRLWRTARTAVHILPPGSRTFKAWDFAKNLDMQGWRVENAGTDYEFLPGRTPFWNSKSHPVRIACGDYLVVAVKDSADACLVTPDEKNVGVICGATRANAMRIKMQNHTASRRMRLWWKTDAGEDAAWNEKRSVCFDVKPMDDDDTVYAVPLPRIGNIRQLKLSFSADGGKLTGTCRIDYIWLGRS